MAAARSHEHSPAWEFRLLGPLEVRRDGQPVPLGAARQRALLTALLLDSGHALPARRLVELLWDDRPPVSAAANIRTYAARLRPALADPGRPDGSRLVRSALGYLVDARPEELDVVAFTELADRGRRALADRRWDEAAASLGRALARWRGAAAVEDVACGDALSARPVVFDELRLVW